MKISLDATYSLGAHLSGVGVYSREILHGLANKHPEIDWRWLYRPHRFRQSLTERMPSTARRRILFDRALWRSASLFHGLNQRLPIRRFPLQVVTFHDLFVMTAEYSTPEFRARFTAQARHAAQTADHVIAVSHFTAGQVTRLLGVEPSRVTVVPHGVRPLPLRAAARSNLILHVGAIQKRKNLVRLVRAFDSLPGDWRLILAGSEGFGAEAVLEAIRNAKGRERITVTGYVDPVQLGDLYSRARIFAFPSLDEGFGMPVLEAMSAGVPVLTSNNSALVEVAGDAALLVDPQSEEQIREGLRRLISDPELRESFISKGKERASRYSWDRATLQTWRLYEAIRTAKS